MSEQILPGDTPAKLPSQIEEIYREKLDEHARNGDDHLKGMESARDDSEWTKHFVKAYWHEMEREKWQMNLDSYEHTGQEDETPSHEVPLGPSQ